MNWHFLIRTFGELLAEALQGSCRQAGAAIELWLATRAEGSSHTLRAYRREALRFMLWLIVERGAKSLFDASLQDCLAFREFMAKPTPAQRWCGPRGPEIGSPAWKPFEGPVSVGARRQAVVILTGLYRFMQDQRIVTGNPWSAVRTPRHAEPTVDPSRSLSATQWAAVQAAAARLTCASRHDSRQLRWLVELLRATGLRRAEMTAAKVGDLYWADLEGYGEVPAEPSGELPTELPDVVRVVAPRVVIGPYQDATPNAFPREGAPGGWMLRVVGKGQRQREVPVPGALVEQIHALFALRGWRGGLLGAKLRPLLVSWGHVRDQKIPDDCTTHSDAEPSATDGFVHALSELPLSDRALSRKLARVFELAAQDLAAAGRPQEAQGLARATAHWLRHTHATHCIEAGVPLDVVQQNLGHASLATTSVYVRAQLGRRVRETGRLNSGTARTPLNHLLTQGLSRTE